MYPSAVKVKVVHEKQKNKIKSYGFVYFEDKDEGGRAITEQDGAVICGKPIKMRLGFFKPSKDTQKTSQYDNKTKNYVQLL